MLTIGLSAVLIVTLIILFACISENINLKMEVEELKRQNERVGKRYVFSIGYFCKTRNAQL